MTGAEIKERLNKNHLSQTWLFVLLNDKGVYVDRSAVAKILSDNYTASKGQLVLEASAAILDAYDEWKKALEL